jgi:hypothetical protein
MITAYEKNGRRVSARLTVTAEFHSSSFAKSLLPEVRSNKLELITAGALILNEYAKPHKQL